MIKVDSFSFQGVNGAYSEQAGKNIFPNATSIPCATFEDMFEHVRSGKSEAAMVPIENSLAGRVADTQRLIPDSNLKITYEHFHEVNHNLLGIRGAKISDIKRIRSNEQVIAQCRNKILKLDKQMIVEADTAGSAKLISELNITKPIKLVLKTSTDPFRVKIATIIQNQLKNVGIDLQIKSLDLFWSISTNLFSIILMASSYFTGFFDFLISMFINKLYSFHYVLKDPTE